MQVLQAEPLVRTMWWDSEGRVMMVAQVRKGAPDGREVVGTIRTDERAYAYACTLTHWAAVWRDKAPRWEGQI